MRAQAVIEAELIAANGTAKRLPRVVEDGRSLWDVAHRQINCLLHEWRETVRAETAAVGREPA